MMLAKKIGYFWRNTPDLIAVGRSSELGPVRSKCKKPGKMTASTDSTDVLVFVSPRFPRVFVCGGEFS